MLTRREFGRRALAGTAALLMSGGIAPVRASQLTPTPSTAFADLVPLWGDIHAHSAFSDARGLGANPEAIIRRAFDLGQDFFFLTDHAEQLTHAEARALYEFVRTLQRQGLLCDIGCEWTGIPDEGDPGILANPAYVQGGGHILLYRTSEIIGHHVQAGGEPDLVASSYYELLAALAQRPWILGGFAHPERYGEETTFGGFTKPPLSTLVRQMAICELSSHGARGYHGPGRAEAGIRASNEAGFRQLIRVGWRPGAAGSSDRHVMPYSAGPYTVAFARARTLDALYEAITLRRICFSEDRDMAIRLIGWPGERTGKVSLMGDTIAFGDEAFWVHADVVGSVPVQRIELIVVGARTELDQVISSHDFIAGERHFGTEFRSSNLQDWGARAVYAKAFANHKQLVSSPIFINR